MHAQSIKNQHSGELPLNRCCCRHDDGRPERKHVRRVTPSTSIRGLWEEPQGDDSPVRRPLRGQTDSRTKSPLRPVEELV